MENNKNAKLQKSVFIPNPYYYLLPNPKEVILKTDCSHNHMQKVLKQAESFLLGSRRRIMRSS